MPPRFVRKVQKLASCLAHKSANKTRQYLHSLGSITFSSSTRPTRHHHTIKWAVTTTSTFLHRDWRLLDETRALDGSWCAEREYRYRCWWAHHKSLAGLTDCCLVSMVSMVSLRVLVGPMLGKCSSGCEMRNMSKAKGERWCWCWHSWTKYHWLHYWYWYTYYPFILQQQKIKCFVQDTRHTYNTILFIDDMKICERHAKNKSWMNLYDCHCHCPPSTQTQTQTQIMSKVK